MKILIFILLVISNLTYAFPIPGERLPIPIPMPRCRVLQKTFFINIKYKGISDGNIETPFKQFSEALLAAKNLQVCNLELKINDGTYGEIINIDRNTTITALGGKAVITGSILNTAGSNLKINGIQINSANDIGLSQSGGLLEINNSSIIWTKAQRNSKTFSGTGLILSNSTRAILNTVHISENQNRGIYLTDPGSTLWAYHLILLRNKFQGIEITNGAKAFFNDLIAEENIKAGVFISDGSKVNIQNSRIRFSKFLTPNNWGNNIVITNNSILDIFNFNSSGADAVGVAFDNAFFTASLGQIDNNPVGIAFFHTTYNIVDCVGNNVTLSGNGSKVSSDYVPLPSTCTIVDDTCMQQKNCARVPWEIP